MFLVKFPKVIFLLYFIHTTGIKVASARSVGRQIKEDRESCLTKNIDTNKELVYKKVVVFTHITHTYAKTSVFYEVENPSNTNSSVLFEYELNNDAFITNFTMQINRKMYQSKIVERMEAQRKYTLVNTVGGLINNYGNIFNISIDVPLHSTIMFNIEYEEELQRISNGKNSVYNYSTLLLSKNCKTKMFRLDVTIQEYNTPFITLLNWLNKSNQPVQWKNEPVSFNWTSSVTGLQASRLIWDLSNETDIKNNAHKFELAYKIEGQNKGVLLVDNGYFIYRKSARTVGNTFHVILVLDISDSMMEKSRLQNLKDALINVLTENNFKLAKYLSMVLFSSEAYVYNSNNPQHRSDKITEGSFILFNKKEMEKLKQSIKNIQPKGSTNLYEALEKALMLAQEGQTNIYNEIDSPPIPIIVFLTDGKATSGKIINSHAILGTVKSLNIHNVPIYSLGYGSESDYELLQNLSSQSGGISLKVDDDIEATFQLEAFFKLVIKWQGSDMPFVDLSSMQMGGVSQSPEELEVTGHYQLHEGFSLEKENSHMQNLHGLKINYTTVFTSNKSNNKPSLALKAIMQSCSDFQNHNIFSNFIRNSSILCWKSSREQVLKRLVVHRYIKKLSHIALRNRTVSNKIVELSKKYQFLTPFTSLLVVTPFDVKTRTNKVLYVFPEGLSETNDVSKKQIITTNDLNMVNYSSDGASSPRIRPKLKLSEELSLRIIAQDEKIKKWQKLLHIRWLPNPEELVLKSSSGNSTTLKVLKYDDQQFSVPSRYCTRPSDKNTLCTHLVNCILDEFVNNARVYMKKYFCQFRVKNDFYAGVCCPNL